MQFLFLLVLIVHYGEFIKRDYCGENMKRVYMRRDCQK